MKIICHFISLLLLLFISCKESTKSRIASSRFNIKTQDKQYIGIEDYAEIIYKPQYMDTLKLGKEDVRKVYLSYSLFDKPQKQDEIINGKFDHYFAALEGQDSIIPFGITVNKLGEQWLEGFVIDSLYLNNYYKNGNSRLISNQIRVQRKIIGIEKK